MICPNCGKEINEGARFCTGCGFALTQQPAAQQAQPQSVTQPAAAQPTYQQPQNAYRPQPPQGYQQPQQGYQQPYQPQQQSYQQPQRPKKKGGEDEKESGNGGLVLGIVLGILIVIILIMVLILTDAFEKIGFGKKGGKESSKIESVIDDEDEDEKGDKKEDKKDSSKKDAEGEDESEDASETSDGEKTDATEPGDPSESSAESSEESSEAASNMVETAIGTFDKNVTEIDMRGISVDSLEGVEQLTSLQSIYIDQGMLSDVTPLAGLTELKNIMIKNVPVADILPLVNLPNLETLNIIDTAIDSENAMAFLEQTVAPDLTLESYVEVEYKVVETPLSWTEAKAAAEVDGGHLAVINSADEFETVSFILDQSSLIYVWLGAWYEDGAWHTVTGESFDYANWYEGEPSGKDTDGTVEDRLCIWYLNGKWSENDQRDNLNTFLGSSAYYLGYLVEYERPTGINPHGIY